MSKELSHPPKAQAQSEQTFFDDPVQDRMLALSMALANELWVAKSQIRRLEELGSQIKLSQECGGRPASDEERRTPNALDSFSATLMDHSKAKMPSGAQMMKH